MSTPPGELVFYPRMLGVATRLIEKYGITVPLTRLVNGVREEHQITGIFASPITNYFHQPELEQVEKRGVFNGSFEIKNNDRVEHFGTWIVMRSEPIRPSLTALVYRVEFRRG